VIFRQLFDRESCTYTYVLGDGAAGVAAIVDPVRDHVARDLALVLDLGLELTHVLETHVHADHVTGAGELRQKTGARTHVSKKGGAPCADVELSDGDVIRVGAIEVRALATPGHTGGCLSYLVGEGGKVDRVLTGDALLVRGCGRTDFQEGDAGTLYDSVTTRLFTLGDEVLVYPAHDYKGFAVSTIGEEKRHNPRLGGKTREEFIAIMSALHLPRPAKMDEVVPANRACGEDGPPPPQQG
jgi:sulfur dioxygenase